MHVVTRRTLKEFWETHPDSEDALRTWLIIARRAKWATCLEITQTNPNARCLADNRVCFNIKGNDYRLIVRIEYSRGMVFIRFVGTHAEYDDIDPLTV